MHKSTQRLWTQKADAIIPAFMDAVDRGFTHEGRRIGRIGRGKRDFFVDTRDKGDVLAIGIMHVGFPNWGQARALAEHFGLQHTRGMSGGVPVSRYTPINEVRRAKAIEALQGYAREVAASAKRRDAYEKAIVGTSKTQRVKASKGKKSYVRSKARK